MEISASPNQIHNTVSATKPSPNQTQSFFTNLLSQFASDDGLNEATPTTDSVNTNQVGKAASAATSAPLSNIVNHAISTALDNAPKNQSISPELVNLFQNSLLEALTASLYQSPVQTQVETEVQNQTDLVSIDETMTGDTASEKSFGESILDISFGDDGFGMDDVFDAVNVLNHIPIVSDVYQEVSDNTVDAFSSLAGSFMLYGPAGLAISAVNIATEQLSGESLVGNAVNFATDLFNSMMSDEANSESPVTSTAPQPDDTIAGLSSPTFNNGGVR